MPWESNTMLGPNAVMITILKEDWDQVVRDVERMAGEIAELKKLNDFHRRHEAALQKELEDAAKARRDMPDVVEERDYLNGEVKRLMKLLKVEGDKTRDMYDQYIGVKRQLLQMTPVKDNKR